MNPFQRFPEEIWIIILNNVEDSQDVWNILRAYPQLDNNSRIQKKKHVWLFGLVVPHLLPRKRVNWINEKELLNCRLVSKQWSTGVDKFLNNQPRLKAYRPEEGQGPTKLFWDTKPYFDKIDCDDDIDEFYDNRPRRVPHFGGTFLDFPGEILEDKIPSPTKFLKAMESHPTRRSPFLSRSLTIRLPYERPGRNTINRGKVTQYWNDLVSIHQKFGAHVWNYDMNIPLCKNGQIDDPQRMSQCLSQLTNLRWLSISADGEYPMRHNPNMGQLMASLPVEGLPPLPNLETLRIHTPFQDVGHPLITRFSTQIRRLEISIWLWRNEYRQIFPNLTELGVAVRRKQQVTTLKELLMSLEAPQLARFQLHANPFGTEKEKEQRFKLGPLVMEDDVFQWLKRFPSLIYLDLGEECDLLNLEENGTLSPGTDSIHSLRFLSIRTSLGLSYNFLRCLPSLQHLQLYTIMEPSVHDNSGNPGGLRIREEIMHADVLKSNVWELLPKLRTVTLVQDNAIGDESRLELQESWPFNREQYEFARRGGNMLDDDEHEREPLREDIRMYIHYMAGDYDD